VPLQQKPLRRTRVVDNNQQASSEGLVRRVLGWIPRAVKIVLAIGFLVLVLAGYRAAASASFFQVRNIDVSGVSKTTPEQVKAIVRRLGGSTGVWRADLTAMSSEIGQLTWVRSAIVSRVLPDGVRVRITERKPTAIARLSTGRFFWVDEEAVMLGEAQPSEQLPDFFIRGWDEGQSADAHAENRRRVQRFQEILRDFSANGFSSRVSELDLTDLSDIRVQLAGEDADVSVRVGKEDFANHFKGAVKRLDEAKSENPGLRILYVDNSMGARVTLGTDRQIVKPLADTSPSTAGPSTHNSTVRKPEPKKNDKATASTSKPKLRVAQHAFTAGRLGH
jgi:cell division septal protein FtsQ